MIRKITGSAFDSFANHAGFGMCGEQKGDGKATVTNAMQIEIGAEIIADFVK